MVFSLWIIPFLLSNYFAYNDTPSFPYGFYKYTDKEPERSDYVLACPPNNDTTRIAIQRNYLGAGYCPSGSGYIIKKIEGIEGDRIDIKDIGIYINGKLLPNTAKKRHDMFGKEMPSQLFSSFFTLGAGEFFLISTYNAFSFDARYFGVIQKKQIKTVLIPFLTWDAI